MQVWVLQRYAAQRAHQAFYCCGIVAGPACWVGAPATGFVPRCALPWLRRHIGSIYRRACRTRHVRASTARMAGRPVQRLASLSWLRSVPCSACGCISALARLSRPRAHSAHRLSTRYRRAVCCKRSVVAGVVACMAGRVGGRTCCALRVAVSSLGGWRKVLPPNYSVKRTPVNRFRFSQTVGAGAAYLKR